MKEAKDFGVRQISIHLGIAIVWPGQVGDHSGTTFSYLLIEQGKGQCEHKIEPMYEPLPTNSIVPEGAQFCVILTRLMISSSPILSHGQEM